MCGLRILSVCNNSGSSPNTTGHPLFHYNNQYPACKAFFPPADFPAVVTLPFHFPASPLKIHQPREK
jgi:hypothetical protein